MPVNHVANHFHILTESPCPLTQAVVNAQNTAATLTIALLTDLEPDLRSDIKEEFGNKLSLLPDIFESWRVLSFLLGK